MRNHYPRLTLTSSTLAAAAAAVAITLAGCGSSGQPAAAASHSTASARASADQAEAAAEAAQQQCGAAGGVWLSTGNGTCEPAAATPAPATPAPTTPAAPATPAITVSQQQAVDAAQNYLSLGTGFSYTSLLNQLTSQYGSGLSQADATFAIRYLHPDWYQQAVEAAKGYMNLGTGFSRASLIAQLTSPYGNGFTYNQAAYAAGQVGL